MSRSQRSSSKQSSKRVHVSSSSGDEVFSGDLAQINKTLEIIQNQLKSMVTIENMDNTLQKGFEKMRIEICKKINADLTREIGELKTSLAEEKEKVQTLISERDKIKSEMLQIVSKQQQLEVDLQDSIKLGNRYEQYSRKKNIKILGIKEKTGENIKADFKNMVSSLTGIQLDDNQIVAIHRLPSKYRDRPRPIILKLFHSEIKISLMRKKQVFRDKGILMFEDVTKRNGQLINRLKNNDDIASAWLYNGSVFAKTTQDERLTFDLFDNISESINDRRRN
ncbi:hypothetical protein SNE40_013032 [Patella caerulea]|uniref:Uncharacterized protein n=1 Tax=Patella caerulea TaxID=87958 RepID=A0AAN8JQP1_PATCE